jgi:hypothetical protein
MLWLILLAVVVVGAIVVGLASRAGSVGPRRGGRAGDATIANTRGKDEGRGYTPTSI